MQWPRLRPYLAASGALLLIGLTDLIFLSGESAQVTLVVPPQLVERTVNLNTVSIQHLDAQVTETWPGTASTVAVAASPATGSVRFNLVCSASSTCQPLTVPAGTIVKTSHNVRFATRAAVTLQPPVASQRGSAPIQAVVPGSAGNQPAGSIEYVDNSPRPCCLTLVNTAPTTGGADAGMGPVIQQSDMDSARAALTTQVTNELNAALSAKASGLTYIPDSSPVLSYASDHSVGDKTATFSLTAAGKVSASAFSRSQADGMVRAALGRAVPAGYRLLDPIKVSYTFQTWADGSHPSVVAHAVAYAVPSASTARIAQDVRGHSTGDAANRLRSSFRGATVRIQTGPLPLPFLPLVARRIAVSVRVLPQPASGP